MSDFTIRERTLTDAAWPEVERILKDNDIRLDTEVAHSYIVFNDVGAPVATASTFGNTIKSIAVARAFQGSNVLGILMNDVIERLYASGHSNVFIYTKCTYAETFKHLGFFEIERVADTVVLLERRPDGIQAFVRGIEAHTPKSMSSGAIVMNGNPFTLGHRHLVERAAEQCAHVYVFVVNSDRSIFPTHIRHRLILEGTRDIKNVSVVRGGDYIISDATFPTYFLKRLESATALHTELDLKIFGRFFAKPLGITKRFVGTEPYCEVTQMYNIQMKRILPDFGVEIVELPRMLYEGTPVSASRVRGLLASGEAEAVEALVHPTTYAYLSSVDGERVIEQLKHSMLGCEEAIL